MVEQNEDQGKPLGRQARRKIQEGSLDEGTGTPNEVVLREAIAQARREEFDLWVKFIKTAAPDGTDFSKVTDHAGYLLALAAAVEGSYGRTLVRPPDDLSVFSWLACEVDCGRMTMPQARSELGAWFKKQDYQKIERSSRDRMRRLKQITDALYEQLWSLLGSHVQS